MKYIKCIKDTALLTAGTWYGISELNSYGDLVTVFRPSDNDWVMSDKENFDMGFLLDNSPDFKMKEFQNKQHERLHNALIGAGFTNCGGKNLPNDTVSWNCGYINKQLDEYLYFDYCVNGGVGSRVFIRNISNDDPAAFYNAPIDDIIAHYEALAPTQPITKDNILDVLKHNGYNESTLEAYCELCIRNSTAYYGAVMLNNVPNWIGAVEAIVGKLKPLPKLEEIELKVGDKIKFINNDFESTIDKFNYAYRRIYLTDDSYWGFECIDADVIKSVNGKSGIYRIPEFNFEQYLLDNGFSDVIYNGIFYMSKNNLTIERKVGIPQYKFFGNVIATSQQNADILIAMANLAKDLK